MTLFEGNLPQNNREREKERKKESERVGCQMLWYLQEAGHHRLNFLHRFARSVNVRNSICLVYAKFNGLSCMAPGYRFGGAYRFTMFRAHLWQKTPSLQRFWPWLTHMYVYIYIIYIYYIYYIYMYIIYIIYIYVYYIYIYICVCFYTIYIYHTDTQWCKHV